jgi:hypothetical protein
LNSEASESWPRDIGMWGNSESYDANNFAGPFKRTSLLRRCAALPPLFLSFLDVLYLDRMIHVMSALRLVYVLKIFFCYIFFGGYADTYHTGLFGLQALQKAIDYCHWGTRLRRHCIVYIS